jgi:phosphatidylglycerophosphate synthase
MRTADLFTALRVATVPVVMWLIISDQVIAALCVYAWAIATDLLDGYFARRSSVVVSYGSTFDASADMTLFFGPIVALAIRGEALWLLVGGIVALVCLVPIFGLIMKRKGGFTIPRLDTGILAFSVHTTIVAHILGWQYAELLVPFLFLIGLFYARRYIAFAFGA